MGFVKLSEILEESKKTNTSFWEVILQEDTVNRATTKDESFSKMRNMIDAMILADASYDPNKKSVSGLAGGDGAILEAYRCKENRLIGDFLAEVIEKAVKMAESNACMRRIVAVPTAGSCGVIPAVLLTYMKHKGVDKDRIVEALYVAGGIGEVIAASASISGAKGGCQAEIGSASAMAAGAITYLEGGGDEDIVHASALALKNMLGLTCDPVAGLVEVPCIKRNVSGAVNAVIYSQMALAGIRSSIEPDEVIDSMRRIGQLIPSCLRETSQEGLAITKTAMQVSDRIKHKIDS